MSKIKIGAVAIACGLAVSFSGLVQAKDFDQRLQHDAKSRSAGLGVSEVPLLRRALGKGANQALREAQAAASAVDEGAARASWRQTDVKVGRHTRFESSGGHRLKISDDGSNISYRASEDAARAPGVALNARRSNDELERMGREFVQGVLAEVAAVGVDDELVPLKTEHEVDSRQAANSKVVEQQVVASTVVFGRRVGGIDIVGAGSKIAVTFDNAGKVLGFDVDWPAYEAVGKKQRVLAVDALRARAGSVASMKFGAEKIDLKRFACGYVDMGVRRHNRDRSALIQAGCQAAYVGTKTGVDGTSLSQGTFDFVPAGESVEPDSSWPQAEAVRIHGDISRVSELTPALYPTTAPQAPVR